MGFLQARGRRGVGREAKQSRAIPPLADSSLSSVSRWRNKQTNKQRKQNNLFQTVWLYIRAESAEDWFRVQFLTVISRLTDQPICIIRRFHTHWWYLVIFVDTSSSVSIIHIWLSTVHIQLIPYVHGYTTMKFLQCLMFYNTNQTWKSNNSHSDDIWGIFEW